jgi:cathepsin X
MYLSSFFLLIPSAFGKCRITPHSETHYPSLIKSLAPSKYISWVPEEYDMRELSLLTPTLNQHIPRYCGACWLHAAIHTINDRLKLAMIQAGVYTQDVMLARQVVLNCGNRIAGNCDGGTDFNVYVFVYKYGLPDDTCQTYIAQERDCTFRGNCENCDPQISLEQPTVCYGVQRYKRYFATEYGRMVKPTVFDIQAEIYKRGPISCSVEATALEYGKYKRGHVIDQTLSDKARHRRNTSDELNALGVSWEPDHNVEIVGWSKDKQGLYWIVRNSWGTYVEEEYGYFYIRAGINAIGIEDICTYVVMDPIPIEDDYGPSDSSQIFASTQNYPKDPLLKYSVIPKIYQDLFHYNTVTSVYM